MCSFDPSRIVPTSPLTRYLSIGMASQRLGLSHDWTWQLVRKGKLSAERAPWVTKAQVQANKYDLSASRYRTVDREEVYYEDPHVTIERMRTLEHAIAEGMGRIEEMLAK